MKPIERMVGRLGVSKASDRTDSKKATQIKLNVDITNITDWNQYTCRFLEKWAILVNFI